MSNNIPFVTLPEAMEMVKYKYKQKLQGLKVRPLAMYGHRGVGKTQSVQQIANQLSEELASELKGKKVRVQRMELHFMERPDFCGLMYVDEDGRSRIATPDIFPTDPEDYVILFLDEFNRVTDQGVRSGLLNFIEDGEINGIKLSPKCMIVLAGNPPEDTSSQVQYEVIEQDPAILDRLCQVFIRFDPNQFLEYMKSLHKDHPMVAFLANNLDFVDGDGVKTSPRTFESVILETKEWNTLPDRLRQMILEGHLGVKAGSFVHSWFEKNDAPKFDQIRCGEAQAFEWVKTNLHRMDAINNLNRAMVAYLSEKHKAKAQLSPDDKRNLNEYFDIISREHQVAVMVLVNRNSRTMSAWFSSNFCYGKPYFDELLKAVTATSDSPKTA